MVGRCWPSVRMYLVTPSGTDFDGIVTTDPRKWLRVFSSAELDRLIEGFGPADVRTTFFAYDVGGWQPADVATAGAVRYRDPFSQPVGEDRAVAARAVACIELRPTS